VSGGYRPFHEPSCPARDPDVSPELLRIIGGAVTSVVICTCPPGRFDPGSEPVWAPGDEP
jgi:hypothetical protein